MSEKAKSKFYSNKLMLTEEQIRDIEKTVNIKRETRPNEKCVFGIYEMVKVAVGQQSVGCP